MNTNDPFFTDVPDPGYESQQAALEVLRRLLVWMAEGRTLEDRGLRASVALYCIRPDLIDDATLEQIGDIAGRSKQAVHQLTESFRLTTGFAS
jgi:hypothetical protein